MLELSTTLLAEKYARPRANHMSSLMTTIGLGVRESTPRQFDKKSGVLEEERGVWNSQGGGKDKHLFFFLPLHSTVLVI